MSKGKAAVYRRFPFTIVLKDRQEGDVQPIAIKFDPGAQTTGVALVQENANSKSVVWAGEIKHRGFQIKDDLAKRLSLRKGRRQRKTRYRQPRFMNRVRFEREGWIAPSIQSRVNNVMVWFTRLYRFSPISSIGYELVKFDTQIMQNPEVSGVGYQQGELAGYEVREYLLEKWHRKCAYCGKAGVTLEVEHIMPRSRGGSDRVGNLCIACHACNQKKGNMTAEEFGHPKIQGLAKLPLKDAAAVNIVRWKIYNQLKLTGLDIEVGTGGRTKMNRVKQGYEKAHWVDAACVGASGASVAIDLETKALSIEAVGRGGRQMQRVNGYGFPCATPKRPVKRRLGFQTGDIVRCVVGGKHAGTHVARISECNKGNFALKCVGNPEKKVSLTHKQIVKEPKRIKIIQRSDGYRYQMAKK